MKTCNDCLLPKPLTEFYSKRSRPNGPLVIAPRCRLCANTKTKALRLKQRKEIFQLLGGAKCVRCGFTDMRALQIDHVKGGGFKELKGVKSLAAYYKLIRANPRRYQVLCANCNQIKKVEENEVRSTGYPERRSHVTNQAA